MHDADGLRLLLCDVDVFNVSDVDGVRDSESLTCVLDPVFDPVWLVDVVMVPDRECVRDGGRLLDAELVIVIVRDGDADSEPDSVPECFESERDVDAVHDGGNDPVLEAVSLIVAELVDAVNELDNEYDELTDCVVDCDAVALVVDVADAPLPEALTLPLPLRVALDDNDIVKLGLLDRVMI